MGTCVGEAEGSAVGVAVGSEVGNAVGSGIGDGVGKLETLLVPPPQLQHIRVAEKSSSSIMPQADADDR